MNTPSVQFLFLAPIYYCCCYTSIWETNHFLYPCASPLIHLVNKKTHTHHTLLSSASFVITRPPSFCLSIRLRWWQYTSIVTMKFSSFHSFFVYAVMCVCVCRTYARIFGMDQYHSQKALNIETTTSKSIDPQFPQRFFNFYSLINFLFLRF